MPWLALTMLQKRRHIKALNLKTTRDTIHTNNERTNERIDVTTLKQWVESHEPATISRVVKRIERFSGNTGDPSTGAAASELVEMIKEQIK